MSSSSAPGVSKPMVIRKKVVKPQLKRDKLPIANYEHDFIKRLEREKILVVEASTGSGKSTQLPQYVAKSDLFQAERRKAISDIKYGGSKSPLGMVSQGKMVVSTQPNAFAAAAVATRVGYEYDDDHLGRKVGLITPTESRFDPTQCEILFVSDSELVRIMTQDKLLSRVGVLIIDEAHERTLYTDVIMTLAKEIREQRDDFYIVISSATIEVKRFLSFMFNLEDSYGSGGQVFNYSKSLLGFRPTPLSVLGKTYEVQVMYDPMQVRDTSQEKDPYLSQILVPKIAQVLLRYLDPNVRGHALAFVEDTQTVLRVVHHLRHFLRMKTKLLVERGLDPKSPQFLTSENTRVIPLYLSMPLKEQQKIMDFVRAFNSTNNIRYVFIADNVAETSITLPDVKLVIDTGRMMISTYDIMRRLMVTEETFVSKDRASQRQGRTGRTSPGLCVRLYNETDLKMDRVEPDIKRVALDKVALQLAAMNINPKALRLIEPPEDHKFIFAIEQLIQYQCLVSNAQHDFAAHLEITDKGRVFVQLPFAPDTCEQLWQASLISAEATTIMHAISCLFNNESSNIFEHSPGMTWKLLAEQIIDERPFDISSRVGIDNNILSSQHWTPQMHSLQQQAQAQAQATSQRGGGSSPNPLQQQQQQQTNAAAAAMVSFNPLLTNPNPLIIQHNTDMRDLPNDPRARTNPHVWYNPFWQTNPELRFGFNLNSGSDLELGYFMYIMLLHYQKPNCALCTKRGNGTAPALEEVQKGNEDDEDEDFAGKFSAVNRNRTGDLDDLGVDADEEEEDDSNQGNQATDFKRCTLCSECESDFCAIYKVLPTAIKQAENFIRSTRDLVHRSLCRNYSVQSTAGGADKRNMDKVKNITNVATSHYKPHPTDYPPTRVMTHCIYTALSHMAGVALVTNHLAEGVVLPHKYFKMVKATIDPNACSNTVDTYYKLVAVPPGKVKKTRYICVKNFIVIHVTARKAHDYNITCLHPFELNELLPLAQEVFSQNVSSLQLHCVSRYPRVGRGLYSSIDYVLSNQRIDNMARQYDLEKSHLRQQALAAQGNMAYKVDDGETTRNMEAMNWSRFAAIPWAQGVMSIHTLSRYSEETIRRINDVVVTASRHMQHLFERERRSYRLPLSNVMSADINLSHDFSLKELIIHVGDKSFAVRPADVGRRPEGGAAGGTSAAALALKAGGRTLGSGSVQRNQIGLSGKAQSPQGVADIKEEDLLTKEFGGADVAAIATDVRDIEQHWRDQVEFNDDEYAAALGVEDEDDDIEMLDDGDLILPQTQLTQQGSSTSIGGTTGSLVQPQLLHQRSLDRLPSGTGISHTYSQATDRQKNEAKLAANYDPLQITRFPQAQWQKHDAKKNYTNTLSLRRRIDITPQTILAKICTVWDIENNVRAAQNHTEEDLLRTISPLRDVYSDIHSCFEEIIRSLRVLHQYQYFPLIPEFTEYSQTVDAIYDQCTALVKFENGSDAPIRSILSQHGAYDESSGEYFIASLLDIQQFYNAIAVNIEKQAKQFDRPHVLAKDLSKHLSFNFSIFISLNFQLGPRDLISWIQLAPKAGSLFDLTMGPFPDPKNMKEYKPSGLRRFLAPNPDRLAIITEPTLDERGNDLRESLFGFGTLIDPSDLRLLQVSEQEVKQIFSSVINIAGFDCLYTISATVDHSETINVNDALQQIRSTLIGLNGRENYQLEVLEHLEIVIAENEGLPIPPHTRTQITFAGNQATVLQSVRTLLKISEPSSIPLGPLTNSTNALLSLMIETGHFHHFVAKHNISAEYIRHGSDGSLSIWGSAQGGHALDMELKALVAQYEKRRQAFPLPHNIFADLKNGNENSPFYSAYQLLTQHIDYITKGSAKYQLKTDESAFVLETTGPEHLEKCKAAIRGFKQKCSIEDDATMAPCFICLQRIPGAVQRLSTCDHPICGACLAMHAETMINSTRQRILDEEIERQNTIAERLRSAGLDPDDDDQSGGIARANTRDGDYVTGQQEDQNKLLSQLKMTYVIQCPCYQSRVHGAQQYYIDLATKLGIERPQPNANEMTFGKGCEYAILPSDIIRICTPSQIHQVLFLLAKPVMKATNAYIPCPTASCSTLLPLAPHYQQCPRCTVGTCTQCNITNSSLHQIVPCHIFKAILAYHDEVTLRFQDDLTRLLKILTKMNKDKDLGDLSKFTGSRNTLLKPYIGQETQTRISIAKLLGEMTQKYLNDDWLKHSFNNRDLVSKIPQIYINPGIFSQCGSYIRFIRGCKAALGKIPAFHSILAKTRSTMLEFDTKTHYALINELFTRSLVKFAYHGTPYGKNVPLILHHGLDTKFRAGQAHGAGEYLGVSPSVSYDYGREFFVLVMFLDLPDLYTHVEKFCYVIKNPVDFNSAYCLPVGVVRVSNTSAPLELPDYPQPLDLHNPGVPISTSAWLCHLGMDPAATLSKAFYTDAKFPEKRIGVDMPKTAYRLQLDAFASDPTPALAYHPDPIVYAKKAYKGAAK